MSWTQIERFLSSGQAFIPQYSNGVGDSVYLVYKDGSSEILHMKCDSFLNKLLYYFGTSITANRNRYGQLVGKKQLVPIILSYGTTLVPFNVREPIGTQTKTGWFIAKEITGFCKNSKHATSVQFARHEIHVMHSEKFCFEQLKNARCIELYFSEIHEPHRKNWFLTITG